MSYLDRLAALLRASADPDHPAPEAIERLLEETRTVAVVGLSRDPAKAARRVPSYLATKGYEVIPVNPHAEQILGRPAHPHLSRVPEKVELVLVFRPSREAGLVVSDALERPEAPAIWLQEGIMAPDAARTARSEGRLVVQDLCIFKAHRGLEAWARRGTGPEAGRPVG